MVSEPDIVVFGRLSRASSSATPTSAATRSTATAETAAATAAGALKAPTTGPTLETAAAALEPASAAALEVARKLLPARGTALGKSTGLSAIARIEGRALRGEVASPTSSGTLS
jgi:hypothetical protein